MFLAIASHKPLSSFALGTSLVKAGVSFHTLLTCLFIFSVTGTAGQVAGLLLGELPKVTLLGVSAVFQALAAGTFLFVSLGEVIPKEMASPGDKLFKVLFCFLGFLGMAGIKLLDAD
mmetsp:Transcript_24474/g.48143  ORF Transcript_24474/g.48143 Transcript_24474/m.48143 type:complete len:117 (-) Transcript_24474:432-782(-)